MGLATSLLEAGDILVVTEPANGNNALRFFLIFPENSDDPRVLIDESIENSGKHLPQRYAFVQLQTQS